MTDLDKLNLKVEVQSNLVDNCLRLSAMIDSKKVSDLIYCLQEQALRDSLIKLGWTPPQEDNCYE